MKITKVIYLRRDNQQMTEKEILDSLYIHSELPEELTPDNWTKLEGISTDENGNLEIDIPNSLIDDIIYSNTKEDIDKKIAAHLASITQLEGFRSKGK